MASPESRVPVSSLKVRDREKRAERMVTGVSRRVGQPHRPHLRTDFIVPMARAKRRRKPAPVAVIEIP